MLVVHKLMMKNTGNNPVLKFLQDIQTELKGLVPVDFPELYTFDRMKDLPRYSKALALRAERGSLNLASAQKKMQQVLIYSRQLQQMLMSKPVIPPGIRRFHSTHCSTGESRKSAGLRMIFQWIIRKKKRS